MKDTTDNLLSVESRPVKQTKTGQINPTNSKQKNKSKKFTPKNKINKLNRHINKSSQNIKRGSITTKKPVRNTAQRSTTNKKPAIITKGKLKIIPLGGCEEVGRNMTIFEYENDIVILDMGLGFPEEDMPGIDYVIPNISYLKGKEKNIRAVIFSHGHLDHIGAAPILLEQLGYPLVIGRPLTISMIKHKMDDYKKGSANKLKNILIKDLNNSFKFGKITSKFFQMEHSIMDAVGVILETPVNTIIHPGDWTLERDQNNNPVIDYSHLSRLKKPTTLMLESLGAIDVRPSASHSKMEDNITKLITNAPGRVIIGTFSSQIERVSWIIEQAEKLGKKVALDGYSMKSNIEIAKHLGYIKTHKNTLIPIAKVNDFPPQQVIVICTGAQGEGNAVLSRIITDNHRFVRIQKNDTVIFSSSVIPGNERTIQRLKDNLYRKCDHVIHNDIMDVHTSGHCNAFDIKDILRR